MGAPEEAVGEYPEIREICGSSVIREIRGY
jgi:hypothetical protein